MYNLTTDQQETLRWIVKQVRAGNLPEEFSFVFVINGGIRFVGDGENISEQPPITEGRLNALMASGLIIFTKSEKYFLHCTLLGKAYDAVDSNFGENKMVDEMPTRNNSANKTLAIVLLILGVIITLASNVATSTLPKFLEPYLWLSWPLLFVVIVISVFLLLKQS